MPHLWLKYKNPGSAAVACRVNALTCYDRETVESEILRTLRGVDVAHVMSRRLIYDVSLGADELATTTTYLLLRSFWTAHEQWIALNEDTTEPAAGDFIAVNAPGGDMPVEYEDGHKGLPFVSMTLTEKNPRS